MISVDADLKTRRIEVVGYLMLGITTAHQGDIAMHKVFISRSQLKMAKVDWNEEWEEYRIEFYSRVSSLDTWQWDREAGYFTDAKDDAIGTAKAAMGLVPGNKCH